MTVERTHAGHQTRYELRDETGLAGVLTYTADPEGPATWKILLPGPGGTEDLYGTERFPDPDAARLQAWLSPFVGSDHAAELAGAVDAAPPAPAAWRQGGDSPLRAGRRGPCPLAGGDVTMGDVSAEERTRWTWNRHWTGSRS